MNKPFIRIRYAKADDAPAIAMVHTASWQKIYRGHISDAILDNISIEEREQRWLNFIKNNVKILVLEKENKLVGFASLCPSRDADTDPRMCGEISAIYLHPDVWHQGLGKQLCNNALTELGKMGFNEVIVWVLKENLQARKFYEKLGFSETVDFKEIRYDENEILNEIRYKKKLTNKIVFKPLQEDDLNLLCNWLNKPHVKKWWKDELSQEEIKQTYRKRIGDTIIVSFIIYLNDEPIGFIQYYHADKVGDGWWPQETEGTVGIDQFIGEEDFINRGYGTQIIHAFINKLFANPTIKKIITDVDPNNKAAIRCYEKVGFKFVKEITTPDGLAYLMERELK